MIDDNWIKLVEKYEQDIGKLYRSEDGEIYKFFGLVHGDDDFYYGLMEVKTGKPFLVSCVAALEPHPVYINAGMTKLSRV